MSLITATTHHLPAQKQALEIKTIEIQKAPIQKNKLCASK